MSQPIEKASGAVNRFTLSRASKAVFRGAGLRDFNEYRDLGIAAATGGRVRAHVSHATDEVTAGTGRHRHELDFQMIYVLEGTCSFWYEGQGVVELQAGDVVNQPPGILHELLIKSKGCKILEITLPADFATVDAE